jgi:predicted CoA-substrate-specific enzyme activase
MSVYAAGIDIGSAFSKGVIFKNKQTLGFCCIPSGGDYRATAEKIKKELLSKTGLSSPAPIFTVATGLGAKMVGFADVIRTELSCHARGIITIFPSVRTVVDIGDSYSRALRIDEHGHLLKFLLSGKCAGGSARILKKIAKILQVKLEELGPLSLRSQKQVDFNTNCAVFAESEAVSRIAEGASKEDLLAGIHRALAAQVNNLAERVGIEKDYALVGGGAKDEGLVKAVELMNGFNLVVPSEPLLTAALGAAILAEEVAPAYPVIQKHF